MGYLIDSSENIVALSVKPKLDNATREQRRERDTNLPLWSIRAMSTPRDGGKEVLIDVTLASAKTPEIAPMATAFTGLVVDHYAMPGQNGSSGVSGLWFKADGIEYLEE